MRWWCGATVVAASFFVAQQSWHPSMTTTLSASRTSSSSDAADFFTCVHWYRPGHFCMRASAACVVSLPVFEIPEQVTSTIMVFPHTSGGEKVASSRSPSVSCVDPVNGVGRHDAHDPRDIPDLLSRNGAGPFTGNDIVDLHLPGMGMVADGTAGIDPDMVEAERPPVSFPVTRCFSATPANFGCGIPGQRPCLAIAINRYNGLVPGTVMVILYST